MKDKSKGVEGSSAVTKRSIVPSLVVENPEPITAISGLFEEEVPLEELAGDDEDEDDDDEDDVDEKVFSTSSHDSHNDDDDAQGGMGGAEGKGETDDAQNVEHVENLILRLDTYREESEHFHTYTLKMIKEMTCMVNPDFKFDFEEELNTFDINLNMSINM
ncbi:hypothetical protein Hanom_Chr10g00914291 [Helianthus anomalus]